MSELRIYVGPSGDCIAGDRWGRPDDEQQRIQKDFAAGVRLVISESLGEIRGFVPAYRSSAEAFYAVLTTEKTETLNTAQFVREVQDLFDETDDWYVRADTPEGKLLETLNSSTVTTMSPRIPTDEVATGQSVRIGIRDIETAGEQLRAVRSRLSEQPPKLYVLSLSSGVDHVSPDLFFHVSNRYDDVTVLSD